MEPENSLARVPGQQGSEEIGWGQGHLRHPVDAGPAMGHRAAGVVL